MSEENQDWIIPGAKIIEYRHYLGELVVALRTVQSVAPQSFVVEGVRIRKDRMERQIGGDYGPTYHYVNPNSERAGPLLHQRKIQVARLRIDQAMHQWKRLEGRQHEERVKLAKELATLLLAYVKAEQGE